jgi:abortive infection bacteriophage resistance protein
VCAHHGRLWNREFTITPELPRSKPLGLAPQLKAGSRKLYNTLVILLYCLDVIAPGHNWRAQFHRLMAEHEVRASVMDFPEHWTQMPIWCRPSA